MKFLVLIFALASASPALAETYEEKRAAEKKAEDNKDAAEKKLFDERFESVKVIDQMGYLRDKKTGLCLFMSGFAIAAIDCKYFEKAK